MALVLEQINVEGLCFLVISFLLFIGKRIESNKRANQLKTIHKVQNVPCLNCSFFKNEPYLKCAVHPDKVLKKEAIHCVDYCSQDSKKIDFLFKSN